MKILLSCAKDMRTDFGTYQGLNASIPQFNDDAKELAKDLINYSTEELRDILNINKDLAKENYLRYKHFFDNGNELTTILSYHGIAFKYLKAEDWTKEQLSFAQKHLWITSFLYGLLRPLDKIKLHRLEGNVRLPITNDEPIFDYWKTRLTDYFIEEIKKDGRVLLNIASAEMKKLFDWKRVKKEVEIIEPLFLMNKNGVYKNVVVYAKMCRGAIASFVIRNSITQKEALKDFNFEGFSHSDNFIFTCK